MIRICGLHVEVFGTKYGTCNVLPGVSNITHTPTHTHQTQYHTNTDTDTDTHNL